MQVGLDGQSISVNPELVINLSQSLHRFTLAVDRSTERDDLHIELVDIPASPAQVQIVGGK